MRPELIFYALSDSTWTILLEKEVRTLKKSQMACTILWFWLSGFLVVRTRNDIGSSEQIDNLDVLQHRAKNGSQEIWVKLGFV